MNSAVEVLMDAGMDELTALRAFSDAQRRAAGQETSLSDNGIKARTGQVTSSIARNIIVNHHVFNSLFENLTNLSEAVQNVGGQVLNLSMELPEEMRCRGFEKRCDSIQAVTHCLGEMLTQMSAEAEDWAFWAKRENIHVSYRG